MDARQLSIELKNNIIGHSYIFVATDRYVARAYLKQLQDAVSAGIAPDINVSSFSSKASKHEVQNALKTAPAFSDKRIVIIEGSEYDLQLREFLAEYPKNPEPASVLVLYAETFDKRLSLYRAFASHGKIVEFPRYDFYFIKKWVESKWKEHGLSANDAALSYFANAVGYTNKDSAIDFGYVANEAEKAAFFTWPGSKVTEAGLKKIIHDNTPPPSFGLSDAVLSCNPTEAAKQALALRNEKLPYQKAFGELARAMRNLVATNAGLAEGLSQPEISKVYNLHSYVVQKSVEALRKYKASDAKKALISIRNADFLSKSGYMSQEAALEALVTDLACKSFEFAQAVGDGY
ncbi:MAG: DNA polymerase III subunit delta [Eubacteriaceae bacterium]|nr:DNA polymerase III subunit delta [Eubacteriaceae bacterium]